MNSTQAKPPAGVYFATVVVVFFCTLSAADSVGFVPYYIDGSEPSTDSVRISSLPQLGEGALAEAAVAAPTNAAPLTQTTKPVRVQIPAVGLDLPVQNPQTTNVDTLDALLQSGPARYADSGMLGENGNIIIFGHSSHLPIVHNKMYQAFNKLPDLKAGDTITLTGENGTDYLYRVEDVHQTDSSDTIPLDATTQKLTIVTCDTLTGKSARYVLDATFIGLVK